MSVLQNALRPALTPALGSARRGVSRYFTPQIEVAQSYISINSNITVPASTDYEIEFDIIPDGSIQVAIGNLESRYPRVRLLQNNDIVWDVSELAETMTRTPINIQNGKLNKIKVIKSGTEAFIISNGVQVGASMTVSSSGGVFNQLGRSFNFAPTGAKISDLKVWIGGSLVAYYPINRYYTPQNNIVLDESGNGNNGTFINVAAGDSKYYQQRADGNFVDLQGNVLEVAY